MREYYAASLSEFFEVVKQIAEQDQKESLEEEKRKREREEKSKKTQEEKEEEKREEEKKEEENWKKKRDGRIPQLWFRGLSGNSHTLLPTLYRGDSYGDMPLVYNQIKQREDARYQHFKSRTYHLIKTNPNLQSEWLEIYQHYMGKTRLLDWTESAKTALCFAVEAFLDSREDENLKQKRKTITPTVTVINPSKLNYKVYRYFYEHEEMLQRAVEELFPGDFAGCKKTVQNIQDSMSRYEESLFAPKNLDIEMQGIVSLCVLEDMRDMAGDQLKQRIVNMEFNPFYYFILRYYTDALPVHIEREELSVLPPLAVLHPYHSERIRKQRGTFSIYPNYVLSGKMRELKEKRNVDVRTMERQREVNPLLYRIYITNPRRVAEELLYAGERRTELYPDLDDHAWLLETSEYYV